MVASADPVDDELVIDGEIPMVIRTEAPEGHPFDEVLSGWLYRTAETRALEADSFANPAMLYVEQGEAIWNTVEGEVGKSCASCHGDAAESRSEEHTSELQSLMRISYAVFCLKKKKTTKHN